MSETKRRCPMCQRILDVSAFSKNASRKDGLQLWCKQCTSAFCRQWDIKHKGRRRSLNREWREQKRGVFRVMVQKWRKQHPDRVHACNKRSDAKKRSNPMWKITHNIARSVGRSLHGAKNGREWENLLGVSAAQLRNHLEKQFSKGNPYVI